MNIYCDRLTVSSCARIIKLYRQNLPARRETYRILILDSPADHGWAKLLWNIMRHLGFCIEDADFFAGHMFGPDRQSIVFSASETAIDLAFKEARCILDRSSFLSRLNKKWGRNTLLMHIAQSLQLPAMRTVIQFMVADILNRKNNDNKAFLIVQRFFNFDTDYMSGLCPDLSVCYYNPLLCHSGGSSFLSPQRHEFFLRMRFAILPMLFFYIFREIIWLIKDILHTTISPHNMPEKPDESLPSLLVLQEDDLSLDRSYRTQPHWLFAEEGSPPFNIVVALNKSIDSSSADFKSLSEQRVTLIPQNQRNFLSKHFWSSRPVQKRLRKDLWKCIFISIFGSSRDTKIIFTITNLIYKAAGFADLCEQHHVKAFMTCENYMISSDAMLLIAPSLDITTLSYQYSNMGNTGKIGPIMMTTADIMCTFSPHYRHMWSHHDLGPVRFVDTGYVHDSSFKSIRPRSSELRSRLVKAGAQFIICFFDENALNDKYSSINFEDHYSEIIILLELVINDPSIGLVIKTQFQRNSPEKFSTLEKIRRKAKATGRYVELVQGSTRNIVLPSEAALSADIAIGHALGGTASLEAALAGVRSVLLNPCGARGDNFELYTRADIVYDSLSNALNAIEKFRDGSPDKATLGDWSPIIDHFDQFRDERAGHRLRKLLESVVLTKESRNGDSLISKSRIKEQVLTGKS